MISIGLLSLSPEAVGRIVERDAASGPSGTRTERSLALGVIALATFAAALFALI